MRQASRSSRSRAGLATAGLAVLSLSLSSCGGGSGTPPGGDAGSLSDRTAPHRDAGKDVSADARHPTDACVPTASTLAFVQVAAATPQTPVDKVSVPYPSAQGAGHLNVVVVAWNDATYAVTSVTDSNHGTYTSAVGPTVGGTITQAIYYAPSIAAGSNTVTVQFDAAVNAPDVRVLEYAGVAASSPVDETASQAGTGGNASTTSITTASADELLFAAGTTTGSFSGAGAGFTSRIITAPDGDIAEDQIVGAIGTYSGAAPQSGNWVMQLVAFRGGADCTSGGGDGGPVSIAIAPRAVGLTPTQTQQFKATLMGGGAVTWSVDGTKGGSAKSGTISAKGLYTPPGSAGTHTVTVTSDADKTQAASASVAVTTLRGVFTWHNDDALTGRNLEELGLTTKGLDSTRFGKLFSQPVDGFVYAQPLWVSGVSIGGSKHNVVYVATENDTVYAFDADTMLPALWKKTLGSPVPDGDTGDTTDLVPQLGITGTPVIDPATSTLYVVPMNKDSDGTYHHRLHALDLATGAEKFGGPIDINPSVPGTGGNSSGGKVHYSTIVHFQRPALLFLGTTVYVPIGSSADTNPGQSHGWVVGYDGKTLAQTMVYCTSPNGTMASLWNAGGGMAVDPSGNIYFETGNGTFDANTGGSDYGDSVVKINAKGAVLDYFTPYNQDTLSTNDIDLGSASATVVPDQTGPVAHEIIANGKPGILYVINRDAMGHYRASDNGQIVQSVVFAANTTSITGGSYSTVTYFNGSIYVADSSVTGDGKLKAFSLKAGLLSTSPTSTSATGYAYPGATASVSANGTRDGIVWALEGQGYTPSTAPVLHAYDATNLAKELYSSEDDSARDRPAAAVKFALPTVANAKAYVGTQTELAVYGLLP